MGADQAESLTERDRRWACLGSGHFSWLLLFNLGLRAAGSSLRGVQRLRPGGRGR